MDEPTKTHIMYIELVCLMFFMHSTRNFHIETMNDVYVIVYIHMIYITYFMHVTQRDRIYGILE